MSIHFPILLNPISILIPSRLHPTTCAYRHLYNHGTKYICLHHPPCVFINIIHPHERTIHEMLILCGPWFNWHVYGFACSVYVFRFLTWFGFGFWNLLRCMCWLVGVIMFVSLLCLSIIVGVCMVVWLVVWCLTFCDSARLFVSVSIHTEHMPAPWIRSIHTLKFNHHRQTPLLFNHSFLFCFLSYHVW